MDVTDLDVVVPEPKRVKFGGVEYAVPADLPMEIFLRVNLAQTYTNEAGDPDMPRQIDSLVDTLTDLLTWEMADSENVTEVKNEVRRVLLRRGTKYCFALVGNIYKAEEVEAEDEDGPPDQALLDGASNGTKSSTTSPSQTIPTPESNPGS